MPTRLINGAHVECHLPDAEKDRIFPQIQERIRGGKAKAGTPRGQLKAGKDKVKKK